MDELKDPYLLLPQEAESLHPQGDYFTALQNLTKHIKEQIIQPMVQAFQAIAEALQPVFKDVLTVLQTLNDAVYAAYLEDGAIYGETQDGMLRWLREQDEIARLRMQAERIVQHQEAIRSFKRMLADKQS